MSLLTHIMNREEKLRITDLSTAVTRICTLMNQLGGSGIP